jgi:hypothetical protein
VLLLELALCLLPSRALALEGCPSVLKGGQLLLGLSFSMLACASLLAKLLLHLAQVSAQLFGLLGLLLRLSLPGPCPLEGGAVLLELGIRWNERGLSLY